MKPLWLLVGLAAWVAFGCGGSSDPLVLVHSSEEPAPSFADLLRSRLAVDLGRDVVLKPASTAGMALAWLTSGEADLAIVEDGVDAAPEIEAIAPLYISVLHVLHAGAGESSLDELMRRGEIYAGRPEFGAAKLMRRVEHHFGIQQMGEVLADPWQKPVALYFVLGGLLGDGLDDLAGYTLVGLDHPRHAELAQALHLRYPYLLPFVLPAGLYPGLTHRSVPTVAIHTRLVASKRLDADLAFDLAAWIDAHRPMFAEIDPLSARLDLLGAASTDALAYPLHRGARRYQDRNEPGFLERYGEVVPLGITLTIAATSAVLGLRNRRRQRRKDRLDRYHAAVLEIRTALARDMSVAELDAMQATLTATQAEVIQLLIDERIDARVDLSAFLALSNQVLSEVQHRLSAARV